MKNLKTSSKMTERITKSYSKLCKLLPIVACKVGIHDWVYSTKMYNTVRCSDRSRKGPDIELNIRSCKRCEKLQRQNFNQRSYVTEQPGEY